MSSQIDRVKPAAYISPSGIRTEFRYQNEFQKEFSHKIGEFEFSDLGGSYYQDLDITGDSLPIICHFSGKDCDLQADDFEDTLREKGHGTLEHPVYGIKNVQIGKILRRENPLLAGGKVTFELEFFETIELQPDQTSEFNASEAEKLLDESNIANAENYAKNMLLNTLTRINEARDNVKAKLETVKKKLDFVSKVAGDITNAFNAGLGDLLDATDILIKKPLTLALQMQYVLQLPSSAVSSIANRFKSYQELLFDVLELDAQGNSSMKNLPPTAIARNQISNAELFGVATIGAMSKSASVTNYENRPQALQIAAQLKSNYEILTKILDDLQSNFDGELLFNQYFSQSELHQQIRTLLFSVIADIQKRALDLKIEKRFELKKATHYITICNEYYNDISNETLEFFEKTNNLTGDDFFLLPKNKEIIVYI